MSDSFRGELVKLLRVMKLTILSLLLGVGMSYAFNGYSQATLFTLDLNNKTVKEVFQEIEKNSEFVIFYYDKAVNVNRKVSIRADGQTVTQILDQLFAGTENSYVVNDRQIVISKQEKKETAPEQPEVRRLTGRVLDNSGVGLPGATVQIEGTTRGVSTDFDGSFVIEVMNKNKLVVSFIGLQPQTIEVKNQTAITVVLKPQVDELDEVTVVAFAKQKKESVIGSITTVRPADLKVPSSNLTTALAGRIAGIISYQRSGEPGEDNAEFFIRGVTTFGTGKADPLILIDGVELGANDLARLNPDDIASFSIMKDATATALYGARGANGVILVTTKEGKEGQAKINIRFENSFSMPTSQVKLADPITYMKLHNEAVRTRDPLGVLPYSTKKIAMTEAGANPYVYPRTDWQEMMFKDYTTNQRINMNLSGGGKVARYYIAGSFTQDNGVLKVDKKNNFNNNIDLKKYLLRTNVNINVTPTTEAIVRLHATFDDYSGPIDGGASLYNKVMGTNPVLFPAYYPADEAHKYAKHVLFGNYDGKYTNPYAEMVKGYKDYSTSLMMAQVELRQDFDFLVKGLSARLMMNTSRYGYFDVTRQYTPFFYNIGSYDEAAGTYKLQSLNPESGKEYLDYAEGGKVVNSTVYMEGAVQYNQTFAEKHGVSGLLVYTMREYLTGNAGDLQGSLPNRNMGLSGRFTYAYDSRYFLELNFGYNGSERFAANERWGFFPSAGVGWLVSNENFWKGTVADVITKLKLKATYGMVGNDAIGDGSDRFFYLSNVKMDDGDKSYQFGSDFDYRKDGVSISRYADPHISWETAYKSNYGIELGIFNNLEIQFDYFREHRTKILQKRASISSTMGLQANPSSNVGEATSHGIDMSVDYSHIFGNGAWLTARGNFTWAVGKYEVFEEPAYDETPWRRYTGQKLSQEWGLLAERLFVNENEIRNSPTQQYGEYMGGDIKYKDINEDGVIDDRDRIPIGYPTIPEIIYGFGFSAGHKGFDVSAFFQGSARSSFWIDAAATAPFINNGGGGNALLQNWVDSHWSEDNRDLYALWPRLATYNVGNNTQRNTWFMRDGSFLRLKSVELGYSLPERWVQKIRMDRVRIYLSGTNLLTISKFKLWDPEMAGNGLGYPVQRVYNLGVNIDF